MKRTWRWFDPHGHQLAQRPGHLGRPAPQHEGRQVPPCVATGAPAGQVDGLGDGADVEGRAVAQLLAQLGGGGRSGPAGPGGGCPGGASRRPGRRRGGWPAGSSPRSRSAGGAPGPAGGPRPSRRRPARAGEDRELLGQGQGQGAPRPRRCRPRAGRTPPSTARTPRARGRPPRPRSAGRPTAGRGWRAPWPPAAGGAGPAPGRGRGAAPRWSPRPATRASPSCRTRRWTWRRPAARGWPCGRRPPRRRSRPRRRRWATRAISSGPARGLPVGGVHRRLGLDRQLHAVDGAAPAHDRHDVLRRLHGSSVVVSSPASATVAASAGCGPERGGQEAGPLEVEVDRHLPGEPHARRTPGRTSGRWPRPPRRRGGHRRPPPARRRPRPAGRR